MTVLSGGGRGCGGSCWRLMTGMSCVLALVLVRSGLLRPLGAVFPAQLREVYLASNGVFDRSGQWFVIWPLPDVVTRNRQAWSLAGSRARRGLVGFGDDGTGVPFCVRCDGGGAVFAWSAIDGVATLLAATVAGFWSGWVAGTLPPH
jgi:hypothetical protein